MRSGRGDSGVALQEAEMSWVKGGLEAAVRPADCATIWQPTRYLARNGAFVGTYPKQGTIVAITGTPTHWLTAVISLQEQ